MPAPNELVAAPLTFYLAPVGTSFPLIDDAEGDFDVAWEKLGTEGANNYDDGSVTVSHAETVYDFTPAGSTMPTKRFRTGESFLMKLGLADVSPAQYAKVMNDATVSDIPAGIGTAGEASFSLFRGIQVNSFAVLARGESPVNNDLNAQYEFSKAFVSVNGDVTWDKGKVASLPVEILAIKHADSDAIVYRVQTAEAS